LLFTRKSLPDRAARKNGNTEQKAFRA